MIDFLLIAGPSGVSNPTGNPAPSSQAAQSPLQPHPQYPEANIKRLTDMGFSRDQAIQELASNNGDVDKAAASLFAKSLKLPGQ